MSVPFENVFNHADKVIITDIYECRDTKEDIESIDVDMFIQKTKHKNIENSKGLENAKKRIKELKQNYDYHFYNFLKVLDI